MSAIRILVASLAAITVFICLPEYAQAQVRVSVEGAGGFGLYYDSSFNETGYAAGGAVSLGTPAADEDYSFGGRVRFNYVSAAWDSIIITGGPYVEFGQMDTFTGYGYLGLGYGRFDYGSSIVSDDQGFEIELAFGGRVYLTENVFFLAELDLARGVGDINAVNLSVNGGLGVAFE